METQTGKIEVDVDAAASVAEFKISPNAPTVLIVMGMAGSGKTTFVQVSFPPTVLSRVSDWSHT